MAKPMIESKKDMQEELKYMRKGGAPKSVINKERKEHSDMKAEEKAEGYKNGGKVKCMANGGGVRSTQDYSK